MAVSTSEQNTVSEEGSSLGLSDKDLKKLSVQIKDWYGLGIQLDVDDKFLDKLLDEVSFTHTKRCIVMLQEWKDTTSMAMINKVEILIRKLREMNGEEKAIDHLFGLLPEPGTLVQRADFTNEDAYHNPTVEDLSVEGCSKVMNLAGSSNQIVSASGQAQVGNVAINPIAKNLIQTTIQRPTEVEKEEKLNQQVQNKGEELLINLQQVLKHQYIREGFTQFTPSQWSIPYKIDIQELFTDMIMLQNPKSGNEQNAKEITIHEIAAPYKKKRKAGTNDPKRILIQGELGKGKTTLMKRLARSWADDPNTGVFGQRIVFFLELKNMQKKSFLENAIEHGLPRDFLRRFSITSQVLQRLIIQNDKNFVFLCDGYDELLVDVRSDLIEVFERNELNGSVVVVTTRPDNMDNLVKACESHIKLRGFKPERQDEYIRKFFKEYSEEKYSEDQGKHLIKLRNDQKLQHVFEMARTPLFLFYLCTLWKVKQQLPFTVIELYRELLVCKVNQFLGKEQKPKIESFSEISLENFDAMLYVGEVTLDGLFENRLNIKQNELTAEKKRLLALKLGLIFEETSVSELQHMKCFTTTHKSESEFLASLYVAETIKEGSRSDIGQIVRRMLHTQELSQVCKFTVALLGNDAHLFMDYFPLEDFKGSALADLLDECPKGEVEIVKKSIKQRMNEVKFVTINSLTDLNIVKELNNFNNAVTCTLDTTSAKISGSDIPKVLYSMVGLSTLTWHGVNDETLETLSSFESLALSSGLGRISEVSLLGKITRENSCKNLGRFLYNMKAMKSLELPVISYGPGLYTFVSAMYGHHCSYENPSCTDKPENVFKSLTNLTFVLKNAFNKNQRNSGYAHLVSCIMALCPYLKKVVIYKTNGEFEFHLFKKLCQIESFRDRTKLEVESPKRYPKCHASITYPTNDYKNCVSILFTQYNATPRMIAKSKSKSLTLHLAAHQINCKQYFKNCRLMSMPVQLLSEYVDTEVLESLHLTWYQDFLPERNKIFEEIKFISQLMAKHETLDFLSLPCEALSIEQFSPEKHWMVKHIEFTCNDINLKLDRCKKYMTQITGYLLHMHSKTITLPPFPNAFSHLEVQITTEFPPEFLNEFLISGSKISRDMPNFDVLVELMSQLPKSWFQQMDADREGTISFSLPTKREYEDDGYTVTRVKTGLQRKINCTIISFCFGLRGLAPCHIQQLASTLKKQKLCVDVFFIFPELMFTNPYAMQIITGLEEVKMFKMVSFNNETYTNLSELRMVKQNVLKISDLSREQLKSYVRIVSGSGHITVKQSYPSNVILNQIVKKNVADLSTVLLNHHNLSVLMIVDYFDRSEDVHKMVASCAQQNIKCTSLRSLTFKNNILLNGNQAVTLIKCFPNLQKIDLSGVENVQSFFEAVLYRPILSREVLSELNLGDCDLKFRNSGALIAKFLLSSTNLQVFKVTPINSNISASIFIEMVHYLDSEKDSIHKHLRVLSFGKFKFDGVGAAEVGDVCGRLLFQFPKLQCLDMSMFRTGKSSLTSFFTKLNEHHGDETVCCEFGLRHLDLSGHNLKSVEITLLLEALKNLPNLSKLRLEMCRIRTNPGSFVERACKFSSIDLSRCHFENAVHKKLFVAQILRFADTDTKLRLVGSTKYFLQNLGKELGSGITSALRCLDLSYSNLCNVNLDFLVILLTQLKTLVLKNCDLDARFLGNLLTAIAISKCSFASGLTTLDMSSSKFHEPESGGHLVSVLKRFPTLLVLQLSNSRITKAVMEQLLLELKRSGRFSLALRSLVLLDNEINSSDNIVLQVARYLPLGCKVKVNNPKRNIAVSVISQPKKYLHSNGNNGGKVDDNKNTDYFDNGDFDFFDNADIDYYNHEIDDFDFFDNADIDYYSHEIGDFDFCDNADIDYYSHERGDFDFCDNADIDYYSHEIGDFDFCDNANIDDYIHDDDFFGFS